MKKTLLKNCKRPMVGQIREQSMIIVGREMFGKKIPQKDIPMINVGKAKSVK